MEGFPGEARPRTFVDAPEHGSLLAMTSDPRDDDAARGSARGSGASFALGAVTGLLVGVVGFGLVRLAALPPAPVTHYHANWAIVLDGQRLDLSGDPYMEDVARCRMDASQVAPEDRVHMHNHDADVVHVHAPGVTWGHLFANLGMGIGDDYLVTDRGVRYASDSTHRLTFVLNGKPVPTIRNRAIASEDRLLVNYGPESAAEVAATRFSTVAATAGTFNRLPDPATCSGAAEPTFGDRLRRAFWF